MPLAGDDIVAADVNTIVEETPISVASAAFNTTEVSLGTVTATLESGKTYKIQFEGAFSSTVANQGYNIRIRDTTVGGTLLGSAQITPANTSTIGEWLNFSCRYTAGSTGSKTFHITGQRNGGASGDSQLRAASDRTAFFTIELRNQA